MAERETTAIPKSPLPLLKIDSAGKPDVKEYLRSLTKKRAGFRSRLTVLKNFMEKYKISSITELSNLEVKEISLRLNQLNELMSNFNSVQSEIEEYSDNLDEQISERDITETEFFTQIAFAQELVDSFSTKGKESHAANGAASGCCHGHNNDSIRLPIINLPTFDGSYTKWLEFRDTFKTLIHDNDSIAPINKFHYLRTSLQSGASVVIRSLEFVARNYELAWDTLCNRYNNKNILINNHLNALVNCNTIQKESFKALRYLIDQVSKNLNALNTLEVSTGNWDPLVIFLVSAKLDSSTSSKWEEYKGRLSNLPTIDDFKNFIENRANVLETANCRNLENKSTQGNNNNKESRTTKSFATVSNVKGKQQHRTCPVCDQPHLVHQCNKFKELSVEDRLGEVSKHKLCTNCLRTGHSNDQCRLKGSCRSCKEKHNTLVHKGDTNKELTECGELSSLPVSLAAVSYGQVLLCTAKIEVSNQQNKTTYLARALLDTGSQSSFITKNLKQKLGLSSENITLNVAGINGVACPITQRCQVNIKSRTSSFARNVNCFVIPKVTDNLPNAQVDVKRLGLPDNVTLADPTFYKPSEIDILLGADHFFDIVSSNKISLGPNKPILLESVFGWLVAGPTGHSSNNNTIKCNFVQTQSSLQDIHNSIQKFWEVEELPSENSISSIDEQFCESHFVTNTHRLPDGRFSVMMPLKESAMETLGSSFPMAMKRFLSLEKKLDKNPTLKQQYSEFLREYENLGHLQEIDRPPFGCYLPHHCVVRENHETTKLRVVFDASAKTSSSKSLNDIQAVGPVIQSDLFSILIRFRVYPLVLTADIEKMYRQISLSESQRHLQLILWREHAHERIKVKQLNTVTYGMASAPFLSTRCLVQLALECQDPIVSNTIKSHFYIDDLNTGSFTEQELKHIYTNVTKVLASAGFPLRKFKTNCPQLFDASNSPLEFKTNPSPLDFCTEANVLGLKWAPKEDSLQFPSSIEVNQNVTKRIIISTTCKLFDPLGLVSCCIILPKILMQGLWNAKLDWDDPVPQPYVKQWFNFINNLHHISQLSLPRHVLGDCSAKPVDLHIFVDASQNAYAACCYVRSYNADNSINVTLLCAKTRVAPIKSLTIPRLELCAALLGGQLCARVLEAIPCSVRDTFLWSDSTVVLCWLKSQSKTLPVFVRNRVNKINVLTQGFQWKHTPTNLNPADLGSRGVEPQHLRSCLLWWEGPSFLKKDTSDWPTQPHLSPHDLPEAGVKVHLTVDDTSKQTIITFEDHSNYLKLKRTYAYVLRFINNSTPNTDKLSGPLTTGELESSLTLLLRFSQLATFSNDIAYLKQGKPLHNKSRLLPLNPFVDDNGLIRVGGRLEQSAFDYNKKHPIILDAKHHLTKLMLQHEHNKLCHAGPQLLLSSFRESFWPLGGRNLARAISKQCTICTRMRSKTIQPIMGNLPDVRVKENFPFNACGIDFAGPFMISSKKGKGNRVTKAYLCIFVCLAVKALHLEVVSDLSTAAFIMCLRRFTSRRGKPNIIYCDNGKNFVGANNELGKMLRSSSQSVSDFAANEGIQFIFSPAYSPHFGGIWESGVRSSKNLLKRAAGNAYLTFEELATLFSQIEAILNSRPLTPLSSHPMDLNPLTPGHFLIGRPLISLPSPPINTKSPTRYQRIEQIRQQFWDRWRREYMAELQQRGKWKKPCRPLQVGDLVVVKEDNLMPLQWRMGRVTKLYPGRDGISRVADVYVAKGTIRRAVNKLCLLPMSTTQPITTTVK